MTPFTVAQVKSMKINIIRAGFIFYESSLPGHDSSVSIVTRLRFHRPGSPGSFSDRGKGISRIHSAQTVTWANIQEGYHAGVKQHEREGAKSPQY